MVDSESAADRLLGFIDALRHHASSDGMPGPVGQPSSRKTPYRLQMERCLARLTAAERDDLVRLIEKMAQAFPPPPVGAIVPP